MVMDHITKRRYMRAAFYCGVLLTLAGIMAGWWTMNGGHLNSYGDRLIAIGRLFGLLAAWSVIIQVILMSRAPFIERNFDLEDTIQLHKFNGYTMLGTIAGHVVFLTLGYALPTHVSLWNQTIAFNTQYEDVFLATLGTIIFFVASFFSVQAIRKKLRYEIWYLIHVTVYAGILMTFFHEINTGADFINNFWFTAFWYGLYSLAFVVWLRYRVLNQLILQYTHQFRVESIVQTATNTYSVSLTGRNIQDFEFEPGQYATWRFLSAGLWYEAHPFSISSPYGSDRLRFTVKASPSLTEKIMQVKPGTQVLVDGPRGSFTAERADRNSKVVLIAGGIGVAPYLSTISVLLQNGKDVSLLYSVKDHTDVAFRSELVQLQSEGLKVSLYLNEKNQRITPEVLGSITQQDTTVYICGPDGMSRAFVATLRGLGFEKRNIITERFAF